MKYTKEYWDDVALVSKQVPEIRKLFGKKLLITGATGMVCSAVVELVHYFNLDHNAQIQLMIAGRNYQKTKERFEAFLDEKDFCFIEYDATSAQELDVQADYIIHGASNANPAVYAMFPAETLLGNIIGLRTVLEVAKKNEGSRLLYVSSSEVYGNRTSDSNEAYKEEDYGYVDILNPRACYPNGKRSAETLCACYGQEYGVDTVTVRLGHIYGPGITKTDSRASAAFTRDIAEGRDINMKSPGLQLRSYCYTLDCASAILTVLLNGASNNAYNISNKDSVVSIRDMAEALAKAGGKKIVFSDPSDAEKRGYNLMSNSSLNAEKLEKLGWKAVFDLQEGAGRTIKYY